MELISVTIEGFRNIEKDTIYFSDGITSLVSTNSYGKSNLLDAINFAVEFIRAEKETKTAMMKYIKGIPFNKYIQDQNYLAEFNLSYKGKTGEYAINYGFEFEWVKNKGGQRIVNEWMNVKEENTSQKYSRLISRKEKQLYKSSQTGRCNTAIRVEDNELIINRLLNEDKLYYHEIVDEINKLKFYFERHMGASMFYWQYPIVLKGLDEFDLHNIKNVPRVVFRLKQLYPQKYALLENAFIQLFPNVQTIDIKEIDIGDHHDLKVSENVPYMISNKVYSIFVQDVNLNQPIDFDSLSDGAKRIFLMLTGAIIADIEGYSLIEIEEPENSIHPGMLQSYLTVLSQLAGDCRILVTSHSPYIVQYVKTEGIYIGKPNDKGIAAFSRIDSKKMNQLMRDAASEGDSVGDYIFELLSGGKEDEEYLMTYLEK